MNKKHLTPQERLEALTGMLKWTIGMILFIILIIVCTHGKTQANDCEPTEWEMFTAKLFEVSHKLNNKYDIHENDNVVYDWLRNIIYKESKYNYEAVNSVSGATGLIQWMPNLYDVPVSQYDQLNGVYDYFDYWLKRRHVDNRVDMYLCVLYPSKVPSSKSSKDKNVIFVKGTIAYKQNRGLDYNSDGWVSRYEIGEFLKR